MRIRATLKKGVYLDREYSEETENNRCILCPILKATRGLEDYKKKCKMEGDNLIIKGKTYTVDNLSNLPEEINGYNLTCKQDQHSIGFFGELNPMSNFHHCEFQVDTIKYHSTEQFIQLQKAKFVRDVKTAEKIKNAKTPFDCKQLTKEIENYESTKWIDVAKELCLPGLLAKFEQNPVLGNILLSTGSLTLVESSYNTTLGTGIPLHHEDCLKKSAWTSVGLLGEMLMEVRRNLQSNRNMGCSMNGANTTT